MTQMLFAALAALLLAPAPIQIAARSRSLQPGELMVLSITVPNLSARVHVRAFGHDVTAYPDGDRAWRALVGIDLEQRAGSYDLSAASDAPGRPTAVRALAVVRRQFPRRVLTVAPDYVNPPPDDMKRITQENAFLADLYAHPADDAFFLDGFERPVPGRANSSFGSRSVFNGQARSPHAGTDFLSGAGTPVHAPSGGRIVAARDLFFTGKTVIIDHGLGVFSMLAHLSRVDVEEGQDIPRDAIVGLVGATGRVTGPHLHWAMRVGAARVDPLSALALLGNVGATP